jgi:Xaa-Pro aminopeptidase
VTTRWNRAQQLTADRGIDALLITPGADLRYLTGYHALPLERLTCLVLPAEGDPTLVVPTLENPAAVAAGVDLAIAAWDETDDPFALVASLVPRAGTLGVDDHMWASRVFALQATFPDARTVLAGPIVQELRLRKEPEEVDALREAGAAIAAAIVEEGHTGAAFVIVGSGPNGASPHHDVSDRTIEVGDPIVVDIGGTTPAGYCSDSTRNYLAGGTPPDGYAEAYAALETAQAAQREHARPGVTAESVDAVGRDLLTEAGYGDRFIHRTGHGIGQETHEEPYIVAGNTTVLEPGMAFSIEPGVYLDGRFGARIEDIAVCTDGGLEVLNNTPRGLVVLPG